MISLVLAFLPSAIIFMICSFFIDGVWKYYVITSLALLIFITYSYFYYYKSQAKKIINKFPKSFSNDMKIMLIENAGIIIPNLEIYSNFVRLENFSAMFYIQWISIISILATLYYQEWFFLWIHIFMLILALKIGDAFLSGQEDRDFNTIEIRYLRKNPGWEFWFGETYYELSEALALIR